MYLKELMEKSWFNYNRNSVKIFVKVPKIIIGGTAKEASGWNPEESLSELPTEIHGPFPQDFTCRYLWVIAKKNPCDT